MLAPRACLQKNIRSFSVCVTTGGLSTIVPHHNKAMDSGSHTHTCNTTTYRLKEHGRWTHSTTFQTAAEDKGHVFFNTKASNFSPHTSIHPPLSTQNKHHNLDILLPIFLTTQFLATTIANCSVTAHKFTNQAITPISPNFPFLQISQFPNFTCPNFPFGHFSITHKLVKLSITSLTCLPHSIYFWLWFGF